MKKTAAATCSDDIPADASATEQKLLASLDSAMSNATPTIPIPQLQVTDLGPPPTKAQLLAELTAPAVACAASVASALAVIILANPYVRAAFPYYTCVVMFVGAIPAQSAHVARSVGSVVDQIKAVEDKVASSIDTIAAATAGAIGAGKANIDALLGEYKPKLDLANKCEADLKQADPSLTIPDVSALETVLDQPQADCAAAVAALKKLVDIESMVPPLARSENAFLRGALYPILAAQLAVQLYACYKENGFDPSRYPDTMTAAEKYGPILLALNALKDSAIAVVVAAVLCQASTTALAINAMIAKIAKKVQSLLDQEVGNVCDEIFGALMGKIKSEILTLMGDMKKLDGPLSKFSSISGFSF